MLSVSLLDSASKSLALPLTSYVTDSQKSYKLFTPCLSPHTPGKPVPCLFGEESQALVDQKPFVIENCTILNKRNVSMQLITTSVTQKVLFFVITTEIIIIIMIGTIDRNLSAAVFSVDPGLGSLGYS